MDSYTTFVKREHQLMANILDMAEAHLLNVEREIGNLQERKAQIDAEIARLSQYLDDGKKAVSDAKTSPSAPSTNEGSPTVFNPQIHSNQ
jgi:hypothetical protein